ncbi:MAG: hypothetical protein RLZZ519_1422 [Bacteroidota bacterium]
MTGLRCSISSDVATVELRDLIIQKMGKTILWLYILAIAMGLLACEKNAATSGSVENTTAADSVAKPAADAGETVLQFLKWYNQNEMALGKIEKVKMVEGEPYTINKAGTEEYLAKLKGSGFIADAYLESERADFAELEKGFLANSEFDGPPSGFDYDRVLLAQDWNDLDQAKIVSKEQGAKEATVVAEIGGQLKFTLVSADESTWLIAAIVRPDLEH